MSTMDKLRAQATARRLEAVREASARALRSGPPAIPGVKLPGAVAKGAPLRSRVQDVGRRVRGDPAHLALEHMPRDLLAKLTPSQRAAMKHALAVLDDAVRAKRPPMPLGPVHGKAAVRIVIDDPFEGGA